MIRHPAGRTGGGDLSESHGCSFWSYRSQFSLAVVAVEPVGDRDGVSLPQPDRGAGNIGETFWDRHDAEQYVSDAGSRRSDNVAECSSQLFGNSRDSIAKMSVSERSQTACVRQQMSLALRLQVFGELGAGAKLSTSANVAWLHCASLRCSTSIAQLPAARDGSSLLAMPILVQQ
jgi:hypothetical protein